VLVTSRLVSLEQVSSASSPSQMKFISLPMLLIIAIFLWGGNHAAVYDCTLLVSGTVTRGKKWGDTGQCVRSMGDKLYVGGHAFQENGIIKLNIPANGLPNGETIINVNSEFIGGWPTGTTWKIIDVRGPTGGSSKFELQGQQSTTIFEMSDAAVSKARIGVANLNARVSGYNRFDDDGAYDGDYSAYSEYDDQELYDTAWANLQAAREQFQVAQRLLNSGRRQNTREQWGRATGQRLRRYGGY